VLCDASGGVKLEPRAVDRIAKDFSPSDQSAVAEILTSYDGPEPVRVAWDILELSKGSIENVRYYLKTTRTDYRDILYWAEYYDNDPLLRGRDPRKLVGDILDKWGSGKRSTTEHTEA
jgi:hypothetical protein